MSTQPSEPKSMKKGAAAPLVFILIVSLAFVRQAPKLASSDFWKGLGLSTAEAHKLPDVWATYTAPDGRVSFEYPSSLIIKQGAQKERDNFLALSAWKIKMFQFRQLC